MPPVEVALDARASLGESPRWDEQNQLLYWVDIIEKHLHCFNPATGENKTRPFDQSLGCVSLRQKGGFIIGMRHGIYTLDHFDAPLQLLCSPEEGITTNRFNDGRCDAQGRYLVGSIYEPKGQPLGHIYSITPQGQFTRAIPTGLATSNGIAFSPCNTRLYYADTPSHAIQVCDYNPTTGETRNHRLFHQFPLGQGRPDGAAVDAEGHYWSALYEGGRVVRLNPEGEIVQEIPLPARCPTMLAFGDADLKTLYITSVRARPEEELAEYPYSGALFKVRVDVAGLVENRFGG